MSPYEHGEVFVLDDGGEVDLDLGNYERFMDIIPHVTDTIQEWIARVSERSVDDSKQSP